MIVAKHFLKSIPKQSKKEILKKLKSFQQVLLDSEGVIRDIPAGYWIRRVKNTNVFKFRLNNSDRILFTFLPTRDVGSKQPNLLFLKYVTHDQQIREAQQITIKSKRKKLFDINTSNYAEELIDKEINLQAEKEFFGDISDIPAIIVEDNYLAFISEEKNEDFIYYLSEEQYEPLKVFGKPIIICGVGGTGKTAVLINKLLSLQNNEINTAYLSYTDLLVKDTEGTFNKYALSKSSTDFFSLKSFYAKHCNIDPDQIITYFTFIEWLKKVKYKYKQMKNVDELTIWTEIRGIIKGYLGLEFTETSKLTNDTLTRILPLEHYINLPTGYSYLTTKEKESIYKLSLEYQGWLLNNDLYDENDLALAIIQQLNKQKIIPYDFLIVDEVQDLSETQLYMISKLVKKQKNIIFCGDVHQTVNPTFFKFGRLKNLYYSYKLDVQDFILTKNYRNSKGIISLTNKLSTYRQTLIGKTPYDYGTKGIRSGQSPMVIETSHSNILRILKGIKDKHYAAIIVADEEDKQYLINKCPEAQGRIFTVYEIKGLEYETIFCYNIISKHFCSWKKIFNGDAKRKDQYRYYINLFYVAISRAKDHLFILEPEYKNMPSDLLHDCAFVENADHKTYHLYKESSNADWEKEASRLENIGNTEKSRVARDFMREQQLKEMNSLSNHYIKTGNQKLNLTINMENNDLKNGIKYLRLQKYNQAIHSLQQFIENYPDDPEGYYYLGLVYIYVLSGTDYSIRFFDEALKLNPNRYEAYLDKAASLRFINETKKAIKTLNKAIDVNNNIGNAYFIKGIILFEAGQHKEAEDCFKTALRLPCYCFDSVNKVWNANPSLEEEQEFKHNIKQNYLRPCLAKNPPATELKEILQSISLTCEDLTSNNIVKKSDSIDYSLFKLDEEKRLIVACIEGKIPTNTTYSTSTKKYTVHFDKEVCIECQTFSVCPMSTANKIGELKVKKKKLFS